MWLRRTQSCALKIWLLLVVNAFGFSLPVFGGYAKVYEIYGPEFRLSLKEAQVFHEKAEELYYKGDYAGAASAINSARELTEKTLGPEHRDLAVIFETVAEGYVIRGEFENVDAFLQRSLAIGEKTLGTNHPIIARTLRGMTGLAVIQGDLPKAEACLERCLRIQMASYPPKHPALGTSLQIGGLLRLMQGRYDEATIALNQSSSYVETLLGRDNFSLIGYSCG